MSDDAPRAQPDLRPMSEFDPSRWVLVHDQLNDEEFEWWPAKREHYERYACRLRDGRVAWDGLPLDGWRPIA
jgi:hypothetical protein